MHPVTTLERSKQSLSECNTQNDTMKAQLAALKQENDDLRNRMQGSEKCKEQMQQHVQQLTDIQKAYAEIVNSSTKYLTEIGTNAPPPPPSNLVTPAPIVDPVPVPVPVPQVVPPSAPAMTNASAPTTTDASAPATTDASAISISPMGASVRF